MREFMSKNIKRVVSKRVEIIVGQHDDVTALTIKRWKRASYLSYSGGARPKGERCEAKRSAYWGADVA